MAPSTSIIPFPSTIHGTQWAVSAWLDLVARTVMTGTRAAGAGAAPCTEASRAQRALILQQAAASMLAPAVRQPRVLGDLLR